MKDLKVKILLLIVSGLLLVAVIVYMSFAWYTKMTSIKKTEFSVAQWEFSANFTQDDFVVNVFDYSTSANGVAAPGTQGYIQMQLSAANSNTDVEYVLCIDKSKMSTEFQERIYFYYTDEDENRTYFTSSDTKLIGTIPQNQSVVVTVYWEWIYSYDELQDRLGEEYPGGSAKESSADEFNSFDTEVGKNPERYKPDMKAVVSITGSEVTPVTATTP